MNKPIPTSSFRDDLRKHCEMSSQYENLYNNTGTSPKEEEKAEKKDSQNSNVKVERKPDFRGRYSNSWPQANKPSGSKHSLNSKVSCRSADRNRSYASDHEPHITRFVSSDDIVIAKKQPSNHEIIRYARKKVKSPGGKIYQSL